MNFGEHSSSHPRRQVLTPYLCVVGRSLVWVCGGCLCPAAQVTGRRSIGCHMCTHVHLNTVHMYMDGSLYMYTCASRHLSDSPCPLVWALVSAELRIHLLLHSLCYLLVT